MNERGSYPDGHDCSGDAAAYVLGALEEHEVAPFLRHADGCAICRDELASLQVVADMLPAAVSPVSAPRGLRRRVLATVYEEAELFAAAGSRVGFPRPPDPDPAPGSPTVPGPRRGGARGRRHRGRHRRPRRWADRRAQPGHRGQRDPADDRAPAGRAGPHRARRLESRAGAEGARSTRSGSSGGASPIRPTRCSRRPRTAAPPWPYPGAVRYGDVVMVTDEPTGGSTTPTRTPVIRAALQ